MDLRTFKSSSRSARFLIAIFAASMMVLGLPVVSAAQVDPATTFRTMFTFLHGEDPFASLVQGTDGNFYGTTSGGGSYRAGSVFKITPRGTLTTLYSFCPQSGCPDGEVPEAALVLGTDGNFYGTTYGGGANESECYSGCGTFFRMTPAGTLTTLYNFCAKANCIDGADVGAIIQGSDGNFYGTTQTGGIFCRACGTIFKISPTGMLNTLYSFDGSNGTPSPLQGLVQGRDGDFYGTTPDGGTPCSYDSGGCGTIFKVTPKGALTVLHNFTGTGAEGAGPSGTLIQAADGNFYGTAAFGGNGTGCSFDECGTVYKMTPQGSFTTLADLNYGEGQGPVGLIQATDGNFYGTSEFGGSNCDCGSIFEVTPQGVVTALHAFGDHDGPGSLPFSGLFQSTNGTFYGTTFASSNPQPSYGVVYGLSVGLGRFLQTIPALGKVGTSVMILGNGLTGTTSVTFNGVQATFTVASDTEITASVPVGATTGKVQVTTPSGVLSSNVVFRVKP